MYEHQGERQLDNRINSLTTHGQQAVQIRDTIIKIEKTIHNQGSKASTAGTNRTAAQENRPAAYAHGDITYKLPVALAAVLELTIIQTINDHVKIYIKGLAPETLENKEIEGIGDKAKIELNLLGGRVPYFAGVCTSIGLKYEGGLRTVEIEGCSWTYELDIVRKSRSYQKLGIGYQEFIDDVLKDYPQKNFLLALPDNKKYNEFAVQYQETDWEFLKRVAAREGTVLVPEYADNSHRPCFWLGMPGLNAEFLTETAEKAASRDNKKYLQVVSNQDSTVQEKDFITYTTTGYEVFPLGDTVDYAGKKLVVTNILSKMDKGLLKSTYTLAYSEKLAVIQPEHTNLPGVSLTGKVLNSRGMNSKIHLDIDKEQDEGTALWFPYANDTGNVLYCMPHNGETINLYFKDGWEANAIAVNGARKNGGSCNKTEDYNNRYFTNHERKELFLSPDTVSFTTDESAADKITIKMSDQGGVAIESTKDIVLNAANTLSLSADKGIIMEAGKDLGAGAAAAEEPQFCALTGEGNSTSIILQEKYIHLHGTQKVTFDGAQKAPLQPLEQPKEESYRPTTSDWWHMGLAIVGCLPVIGTVANVVDAGLYAAEGHYADAALSLAAAIPGAGEAAALVKVARLGKIISVGAKMAKVAKVLHYVGTAARLIIGAKFIYQIANNKDKVVGMLKRMLNGKFDWSDPRFWTFAACITLALLRGRMTKALDKKLGIGATTGMGKADIISKVSKDSKIVLAEHIEYIRNGGIVKPTGGKFAPSKVCAAIDTKTGEIYYGYSGRNGFNPSRADVLHEDVQVLVENTKDLAKNTPNNPYADRESFEVWPVDNCAEINAVDQALKNGAKTENLFIRTVNFKNGEFADFCDNCKVTFRDFMKATD